MLRPGGRLLRVSLASAPPAGWRERLLGRRLARRGIEPLEAASAGEGSFSIARLAD